MASAAERPSTSAFAFSCLTAAMAPAPWRAAQREDLGDRMRGARPGSRTAPAKVKRAGGAGGALLAACCGCLQCQLELGSAPTLPVSPLLRCTLRHSSNAI